MHDARALGKARQSGDEARIREAEQRHDDYRDLSGHYPVTWDPRKERERGMASSSIHRAGDHDPIASFDIGGGNQALVGGKSGDVHAERGGGAHRGF